jgi:diketogulonate reductase-like aldo/keto reductase
VIPRSSNPERLQENFDALNITPLSSDEMALLDSLQYLIESSVAKAVKIKGASIRAEL